MREIKFRGRKYNGSWVHGELCCPPNRFASIRAYYFNSNAIDEHQVLTNTIGQFTGLYDMNQVPIYEGDIIKCHEGTICSVFWKDGGFCMEANPKSFGYDHDSPLYPYESLSGLQMQSYIRESCEVIGNIHDNPNLINDLRQ